MRLGMRLKRLEEALPRCDPRVRRLTPEGYVPTEVDRCPRCGEFHILVIEEEVVERVGDGRIPATEPENAAT